MSFDTKKARAASGVESIENCRMHLRSACDEIDSLRARFKVVGDEALEHNGRLITENDWLRAKLAEAEKELARKDESQGYDLAVVLKAQQQIEAVVLKAQQQIEEEIRDSKAREARLRQALQEIVNLEPMFLLGEDSTCCAIARAALDLPNQQRDQ